MAHLELDEQEKQTLAEWKKSIKSVFGEEGKFHFVVYTGGIGTKVEAFSEKAQISKDITNYESW